MESHSGEIWEYRIAAIATDCKSVTFIGIGGSSPSAPTQELLSNSVTVAQQFLVLLVQVRILVGHQKIKAMKQFFKQLLCTLHKSKNKKIMKGKKVKLVANRFKSSNNAYLGNGIVYTVGNPSGQPEGWLVYDSSGIGCGWAFECEMVVDNLGIKELEKELLDAKTNIDSIQSKIDWIKETGSEYFLENEFKVYQTLKLLDNNALSMVEKSRLIADLIKA